MSRAIQSSISDVRTTASLVTAAQTMGMSCSLFDKEQIINVGYGNMVKSIGQIQRKNDGGPIAITRSAKGFNLKCDDMKVKDPQKTLNALLSLAESVENAETLVATSQYAYSGPITQIGEFEYSIELEKVGG